MALTLDQYQDKYENYRFERSDDGILQMTMHTNGGELIWGFQPDDDLGRVLGDIGDDPENQVVILTGTGDTFIYHEELSTDSDTIPPSMWGSYILPFANRLINNHLDIGVPMIGAVNGPATIHAEMALLCDIVLASETSFFTDLHFPNGLVPGDGVQVVWPMLIGMNRARYLMYTGRVLTAPEALDLGLVNEVLPKEDLVPRAWELARKVLEQPELTRRLTRRVFSTVIKERMHSALPYGLALEGLGAANYWPREFHTTVTPQTAVTS